MFGLLAVDERRPGHRADPLRGAPDHLVEATLVLSRGPLRGAGGAGVGSRPSPPGGGQAGVHPDAGPDASTGTPRSTTGGRARSTTRWPDRPRSSSTRCRRRPLPPERTAPPEPAWKDAGVPNLRTMVTELGTGLGMLGDDDLDEVLRARSPVMRSLSPDDWDRLSSVRAGGAYDTEFHAAWLNGRTFLAARDGLRGRRPEVVEWKGAVRGSGDEVAPVDLRIDHVYLVSCKYMSNILFNASPTHVFDSLLVGGPARPGRGRGATGTPRSPRRSTNGSTTSSARRCETATRAGPLRGMPQPAARQARARHRGTPGLRGDRSRWAHGRGGSSLRGRTPRSSRRGRPISPRPTAPPWANG